MKKLPTFLKKKSLQLLLLLVVAQPLAAQVYERRINWNLSTINFAEVTACATRSNGNSLIAIRQSYQTGEGAAALAEINANGDTLWTKKFNRGGTSYGENFITFIRELPNHGIFMAGGTHNSSGFYHAALWLADSIGNITNYQQMAYNNYREITFNDIDVASDGSIYFAGSYYDLFSGGVTTYSWTVPLYGKLNPDLTLDWAYTWGSTNHTNSFKNRGFVAGVKLTTDGNLMVLGSDGVDYGNAYNGTLQLAKVTPGGVVIWNKQRENYYNSSVKALALGNNGEIYALTYMPQPVPANNHRHVLEKFDAFGNLFWSKSIGSGANEVISKLKFNPQANTLYFCGAGNDAGTQGIAGEIDTSGVVLHSNLFFELGSPYSIISDITHGNNHYLLAGNAYTYGGMLIKTDTDFHTGCPDQYLPLQTDNFANNPYSNGIYHTGMNFTITNYATNYLQNPISSTLSCFACSDVFTNSNISSCGSYFVGGALQNVSGTYYDTLAAVGGCDSIIVSNLTIYQNPSAANAGIDQQVCSNAAAISANVPTSGIGQWSVVNGSGNIVNTTQASTGINNLSPGLNTLRWTISNGTCNSTFDEVNIFVGSATSATLNQNACDSITLNNQSYFTSGTYTQTLTNSQGCDSTLTINLTILNATGSSLNIQACNEYTFNNQTYTSAGTYTQTFQNVQGCDSIVTLNLALNFDAAASLNIQSCEPYPLNAALLDSTGIYVQNLLTAAGCDSTLTIDFTLTSIDTSVSPNFYFLSANATGAQYQWIDCNTGQAINGANNAEYTPTVNGDYAVVITLNSCTDTSACYAMYSVGIASRNTTSNFSIVPNPANDYISLQGISTFENGILEIISIDGKNMLTQSISKNQSAININHLEKGVYLLRLSVPDAVMVQQLIKQ